MLFREGSPGWFLKYFIHVCRLSSDEGLKRLSTGDGKPRFGKEFQNVAGSLWACVSCDLLWFGYTMSFEGLVPNAISWGRVWGGMMGRGGSDLINELIHQCVHNWTDKGRQWTWWKMEPTERSHWWRGLEELFSTLASPSIWLSLPPWNEPFCPTVRCPLWCPVAPRPEPSAMEPSDLRLSKLFLTYHDQTSLSHLRIRLCWFMVRWEKCPLLLWPRSKVFWVFLGLCRGMHSVVPKQG